MGTAPRLSHGAAGAPPEVDANVFRLGVASGDPSETELVLWTRLCQPPNGEGLVDDEILGWEISTDVALQDIVQRGYIEASHQRAYCVHVFLKGLAPATRYYYRFRSRWGYSPVGITTTMPAPGDHVERFRIAMASCQEYTSGYFTAYDDMVAQMPDLVFFNGDYIYETGSGTVRPFPFAWREAFTLKDYRALYALYRQDASLRKAHAIAPWAVIWDDHEVVNDWGPRHFLPSPYNDPQPDMPHDERVLAARRAFLEHMPLRASASLYEADGATLYRQLRVGDLIELSLLDVRSFREEPKCRADGELEFSRCNAINRVDHSLLGQAQEKWFRDRFARHDCRWNLIGQTTVFAPFNRGSKSEPRYEADSWDNYPQTRKMLLDIVRSRGRNNVVSLGGNIHAFYAGRLDLGDEQAELHEIVTTSISAGGGGEDRYVQTLNNRALNPSMTFFDNRYRGYALLDVGHEQLRVDFRVVDSVSSKQANGHSLHSYAIAHAQS